VKRATKKQRTGGELPALFRVRLHAEPLLSGPDFSLMPAKQKNFAVHSLAGDICRQALPSRLMIRDAETLERRRFVTVCGKRAEGKFIRVDRYPEKNRAKAQFEPPGNLKNVSSTHNSQPQYLYAHK
jgi:hypothetical protein